MGQASNNANHVRLIGMAAGIGSGKFLLEVCLRSTLKIPFSLSFLLSGLTKVLLSIK